MGFIIESKLAHKQQGIKASRAGHWLANAKRLASGGRVQLKQNALYIRQQSSTPMSVRACTGYEHYVFGIWVLNVVRFSTAKQKYLSLLPSNTEHPRNLSGIPESPPTLVVGSLHLYLSIRVAFPLFSPLSLSSSLYRSSSGSS